MQKMRKQRKLKKGLALFLCLVLAVSLLPLAAGPARAEEYNGFNYRVDRSQGIAIIESYVGDEFDLTIPDELGGYLVPQPRLPRQRDGSGEGDQHR